MDLMAMFSTEPSARRAGFGVLLLAAAALGGCASQHTLSDDFGRAVHENLLAQIADPEPPWANRAPPPADGARIGAAIERYRTGKTIKPKPAKASDVGVSINFGATPE